MFVIKIQQLEGITDQRHKCLCHIIVGLPCLSNRLLALTVKGRVCVSAWKCVEHRYCFWLWLTQACTDGTDVEKPATLAYSKGHSDVSQWLSRNQLMEYACKDDYNICVRSTHRDSLCTLLHSMPYMKQNTTPCNARLLMIAVLHSNVGTNRYHSLPWCDKQLWLVASGILQPWKSQRQTVPVVDWVTEKVHPFAW